jgi:hypothetical protein
MRKLLKAINLRFSTRAWWFLTIIIACSVSTLLFLPIAKMLPEPKAIGSFDIEAGVKAATEPLTKVLDSYWGKALFFIFCGGAIARETRGFRAKKLDQDKESIE